MNRQAIEQIQEEACALANIASRMKCVLIADFGRRVAEMCREHLDRDRKTDTQEVPL